MGDEYKIEIVFEIVCLKGMVDRSCDLEGGFVKGNCGKGNVCW